MHLTRVHTQETKKFERNKEGKVERKGDNALLAPKSLTIVENTTGGICKFRWSCPKSKGYMDSVTGYQIMHNGKKSMPNQLSYDRLGKIRLESQVKLDEGVNSIQVRMLFGDITKRLTASDWSPWRDHLDPPPIGMDALSLRHDRLSEYLSPPIPEDETAEFHEKQQQTAQMSSNLHDLKRSASTSKKGQGQKSVTFRTGEKTSAPTSVGGVMASMESKKGLKLESVGPPQEVEESFRVTRQSPFALKESSLEYPGSSTIPLALGENQVYHNPSETGPTGVHSTVHSYLKRILVSTDHADTVVLISSSVIDQTVKAPVGFHRLEAEPLRTVLQPSQQYSANVGDTLLFLDSGVEYMVESKVRTCLTLPAHINMRFVDSPMHV